MFSKKQAAVRPQTGAKPAYITDNHARCQYAKTVSYGASNHDIFSSRRKRPAIGLDKKIISL